MPFFFKYEEGRVSEGKIKFPSNSQINFPILVSSYTLVTEKLGGKMKNAKPYDIFLVEK